MNTILSVCFSLFLLSDLGAGLETGKSISPSQDAGSVSQKQSPAVNQRPEVFSGRAPTFNGIKKVVKVLHDRATNRVMLVGSKEDIAIVKRAVESFNQQLIANKNPIVTEKIQLKFQLAETVAAILSNSMELKSNRMINLKFNPIHFPESILLVGPKASVERAKRLIELIDSHPGFSSK